jgi:hypothetical protein
MTQACRSQTGLDNSAEMRGESRQHFGTLSNKTRCLHCSQRLSQFQAIKDRTSSITNTDQGCHMHEHTRSKILYNQILPGTGYNHQSEIQQIATTGKTETGQCSKLKYVLKNSRLQQLSVWTRHWFHNCVHIFKRHQR